MEVDEIILPSNEKEMEMEMRDALGVHCEILVEESEEPLE